MTRMHMDSKAESERLRKAVCGGPELELPVRVVPGTILASIVFQAVLGLGMACTRDCSQSTRTSHAVPATSRH